MRTHFRNAVLVQVIGAATCALSLSSALAQGDALRQVDASAQRLQIEQAITPANGQDAPELYPDEASDVGPQTVVVYRPRKTHVEAFADGQYFWTENAFLASGKGKKAADIYIGTVQVALAPTAYEMAGGEFSPRIGFRQQWYFFGPLSDDKGTVFNFEDGTVQDNVSLDVHNFNAQTIFTDGRWQQGNWIFGAGFDFTRLMTSDTYDQFYREYVPRWGVMRLFPLTDTTALAVGYEGDYRLTGTDLASPVPGPVGADDFNDRTDHSLLATYTYEICPHALVQPYARVKYTYFTSGGNRQDVLGSAGLAIYGFICPNAHVRAFLGYDIMETDSSVPDYKRFDLGAGLNLNVRF